MSETMTDVSRTLVRAHRIYHQSRRAARIETSGTAMLGVVRIYSVGELSLPGLFRGDRQDQASLPSGHGRLASGCDDRAGATITLPSNFDDLGILF